MRLGKIEKAVLVTLLDETQNRNRERGVYTRFLIKCIAIRFSKWDETRVNWRSFGGVKGLDGKSSFRASLSRAFRQLECKKLVETRYHERWLTNKGRVVARGLKISRAKIKQ